MSVDICIFALGVLATVYNIEIYSLIKQAQLPFRTTFKVATDQIKKYAQFDIG